MYRLQNRRIKLVTLVFLVLFIIELIIYLFKKSNIFGLIYLLLTLLILFLLLTVSKNYNRYYSKQRISKLIIILILGIFTSFILGPILLNNMKIIDSSQNYYKSILITRMILKPLIYVFIAFFIKKDRKLDKIIK